MMWLKQLFSRGRLYDDLSKEIQEHLEEKIEELVAGGLSTKEAESIARREFGNATLMEEDSRAVWRWAAIEGFFMDVRFGARMLRKNPGFAAVTIVTLALGIAANTTIFSAVNGWMLRRPRIKDPARVVVIVTTDPAKEGWGWDRQPVSAFDFVAEQAHPGTSKGWSASAMSIQHYIADEFGVGMRLQMGVAFFVLLIACVNIASLQLARGAERQTEFAVRTALGADRFRLVRQSLVESLLIALAGGGLGLLLASWGVDLFRWGLSLTADVGSIGREMTIDHTVMIFTLGVSVLAAVLFGLVPAVHQTALGLHSTLKEGSRSISQSKARHRTHSVLVTAEIALALVLLIAAGVFVQEFLDRVHTGFGIDSNQVLTANISLSNASYKDPFKQVAFFQEAIQRLEALPGVSSAGATSTLPLGDYERIVTFSIEGRPALSRTERGRTDYFAISFDYLRTLGIPLIRGRNFLSSDNAQEPPVALVNQAFVRRYFPNEDSIGKRIRLDTSVPYLKSLYIS